MKKKAYDVEYAKIMKQKILSRFKNEFKFKELNYRQNGLIIDLLIKDNKIGCTLTENHETYDDLYFGAYTEKTVNKNDGAPIKICFVNDEYQQEFVVDQEAVIGTLDLAKKNVTIEKIINYYVELLACIQKQINEVRKQNTLLYLVNIPGELGERVENNLSVNESFNFLSFPIETNNHIVEPMPNNTVLYDLQTYQDKVQQELFTLLGFNSVVQQEKKEHLINAEVAPQMETVESYRQNFIDCLQGFGDRVGSVLGFPLTLIVTSEIVKDKITFNNLRTLSSQTAIANGGSLGFGANAGNFSTGKSGSNSGNRAPEFGSFSFRMNGPYGANNQPDVKNNSNLIPLPGPDGEKKKEQLFPDQDNFIDLGPNNDLYKKAKKRIENINNYISNFGSWISDKWDKKDEILNNIKESIYSGFEKGIETTRKWLKTTKDVGSEIFEKFANNFKSYTENIYNEFQNWASKNWDDLKEKQPVFVEKVKDVLEKVYGFANQTYTNFEDAVNVAADKFNAMKIKLSGQISMTWKELLTAYENRADLEAKITELEEKILNINETNELEKERQQHRYEDLIKTVHLQSEYNNAKINTLTDQLKYYKEQQKKYNEIEQEKNALVKNITILQYEKEIVEAEKAKTLAEKNDILKQNIIATEATKKAQEVIKQQKEEMEKDKKTVADKIAKLKADFANQTDKLKNASKVEQNLLNVKIEQLKKDLKNYENIQTKLETDLKNNQAESDKFQKQYEKLQKEFDDYRRKHKINQDYDNQIENVIDKINDFTALHGKISKQEYQFQTSSNSWTLPSFKEERFADAVNDWQKGTRIDNLMRIANDMKKAFEDLLKDSGISFDYNYKIEREVFKYEWAGFKGVFRNDVYGPQDPGRNDYGSIYKRFLTMEKELMDLIMSKITMLQKEMTRLINEKNKKYFNK